MYHEVTWLVYLLQLLRYLCEVIGVTLKLFMETSVVKLAIGGGAHMIDTSIDTGLLGTLKSFVDPKNSYKNLRNPKIATPFSPTVSLSDSKFEATTTPT